MICQKLQMILIKEFKMEKDRDIFDYFTFFYFFMCVFFLGIKVIFFIVFFFVLNIKFIKLNIKN